MTRPPRITPRPAPDPKPAQIEADRQKVEAWMKNHRPKHCPPATADNAVSIYVPFATLPAAKKGRRPQS